MSTSCSRQEVFRYSVAVHQYKVRTDHFDVGAWLRVCARRDIVRRCAAPRPLRDAARLHIPSCSLCCTRRRWLRRHPARQAGGGRAPRAHGGRSTRKLFSPRNGNVNKFSMLRTTYCLRVRTIYNASRCCSRDLRAASLSSRMAIAGSASSAVRPRSVLSPAACCRRRRLRMHHPAKHRSGSVNVAR